MLPANWPKWTLVLIALGLIFVIIGFGVILESLSQALAPEVTPVPTLPSINYARPLLSKWSFFISGRLLNVVNGDFDHFCDYIRFNRFQLERDNFFLILLFLRCLL